MEVHQRLDLGAIAALLGVASAGDPRTQVAVERGLSIGQFVEAGAGVQELGEGFGTKPLGLEQVSEHLPLSIHTA